MNVNLIVPCEIAWELMKEREYYADYQHMYVETYKKYCSKGELHEPWAKDQLKDDYQRLEFTWNGLCKIDSQLLKCAEMLGVSRFVFIQVVRIYKTLYKDSLNPMDYLSNEQIERIITCLEDGVYYTGTYNGGCYSPEEIRTYLRRGEWSKVR